MLAGAVMGLLTVTLGANQHVSGLGLTIALIGLSEFANRLLFTGSGSALAHRRRSRTWNPLAGLGDVGAIVQPVRPDLRRVPGRRTGRLVGAGSDTASGWPSAPSARTPRPPMRRASTSPGCATWRSSIGSGLMAVGGAFLTLAVLGSFTLDIIAGRGWVCIALVIFGRWRIWRGVGWARSSSRCVYSLGLRLRILPGCDGVPPELHAGAAVPRGHRGAGHLGPQRGLSGRLSQAIPSE